MEEGRIRGGKKRKGGEEEGEAQALFLVVSQMAITEWRAARTTRPQMIAVLACWKGNEAREEIHG